MASILDILFKRPEPTRLGDSAYADTMIRDQNARPTNRRAPSLAQVVAGGGRTFPFEGMPNQAQAYQGFPREQPTPVARAPINPVTLDRMEPVTSTGLDLFSDKRKAYYEVMSKAWGRAAILNMMKAGAGDELVESVAEDVEKEEAFKDDEYIQKVNKEFKKPYKNKRELFDRLVKPPPEGLGIPIHIAGQLIGYVPDAPKAVEQVNWVNPATDDRKVSGKGTPPGPGYLRETKGSGSLGVDYNQIKEAMNLEQINPGSGVDMLAQIYLSKAASDPFSSIDSMEDAIAEAQKVLGAESVPTPSEEGLSSQPSTRDEAIQAIKARFPGIDDTTLEATLEKYGY
jgi:hypothetical protein